MTPRLDYQVEVVLVMIAGGLVGTGIGLGRSWFGRLMTLFGFCLFLGVVIGMVMEDFLERRRRRW